MTGTMRHPTWPKRRRETQATWLARKMHCSLPDAKERLRAFRRTAWEMTAPDREKRADAEYEATLRGATGVRVALDEAPDAPAVDDGQLELPAVRCAA